jgi:hypothetical protein
MAGSGWWSKRLQGDGLQYEDLEKLLDSCASLRYTLIQGRAPLLYCCSICDDELGIRIVKEGVDVDLNAKDAEAGYTALHLCCEFSMPEFALALIKAGATTDSTSFDLPDCLFNTTIPGGRTPLHICALKGNCEIAELLLNAGADPAVEDWEGNTAFMLACMERRHSCSSLLLPSAQGDQPSAAFLHEKRKQGQARTTKRVQRDLNLVGGFDRVHVVPKVFSEAECRWMENEVKAVVAREMACGSDEVNSLGVQAGKGRGTGNGTGGGTAANTQTYTKDYPQYDIRCCDMRSMVNEWVRRECEARVFPVLAARYGLQSTGLLSFRDLFFVDYIAPSDGTGMHADGSLLSFNLLLNSHTEFEGGGTHFERTGRTFHLEQGGVLMHAGKNRHRGMRVTSGERVVLVVFINVTTENGELPLEPGPANSPKGGADIRAGLVDAAEQAQTPERHPYRSRCRLASALQRQLNRLQRENCRLRAVRTRECIGM